MCVRLIHWPIDRLKRQRLNRAATVRERSADSSTASRTREDPPLVLITTIASRQVVAVACDAARARGVRVGMTLPEARALCPGLEHADHEPDRDLRALEALARWMNRFSPAVAIEPPDALMLDVTGSERLFGGMPRLARLVSAALARLGLGHGIAIAPTPGAAWALA